MMLNEILIQFWVVIVLAETSLYLMLRIIAHDWFVLSIWFQWYDYTRSLNPCTLWTVQGNAKISEIWVWWLAGRPLIETGILGSILIIGTILFSKGHLYDLLKHTYLIFFGPHMQLHLQIQHTVTSWISNGPQPSKYQSIGNADIVSEDHLYYFS